MTDDLPPVSNDGAAVIYLFEELVRYLAEREVLSLDEFASRLIERRAAAVPTARGLLLAIASELMAGAPPRH